MFSVIIKNDDALFVTTHSPYLYKSLYRDAGVFITKRTQDGKAAIDKIDSGQGLFPWSPSWGEINHYAFGMPTVELHNELYGYLQERSQTSRTDEFDNHLVTKGLQKNKQWIRCQNGVHPDEGITGNIDRFEEVVKSPAFCTKVEFANAPGPIL